MSSLAFLPAGGVTSPLGFLAGATAANIRGDSADRLDLGIIFSERPATAAAVFTTNQVKGSAVLVTQHHLANGRLQAVIANSGNANTATGERGVQDAQELTALAAAHLGLEPQDVTVTSTGIIGHFLPTARLRQAVPTIRLSRAGGEDFARAIMTSDTRPKHCAVRFTAAGQTYTVGGVVKGSGMIHPNMATMHCFLSTDAAVEQTFLQHALRHAVDMSFHMLDIDGDMSTSDTVLLLANGRAGGPLITDGGAASHLLQTALTEVCIWLAKAMAADGEGATKLLTVDVRGSVSVAEARQAARRLAGSLLVKTAIHGADPNWGRIVAVLGASGATIDLTKTVISLGGICVYRYGNPADYSEAEARTYLRRSEVTLHLDLGLGQGSATAWGCDLSEAYVRLNS